MFISVTKLQYLSGLRKPGIFILLVLLSVSLATQTDTKAQTNSTGIRDGECPAPDTVLITEYPIPTVGSELSGIAVGPDGALWFGEDVGAIGRITLDGETTEYPLPDTQGVQPFLVAGPDGAIWFTLIPNMIGRITLEGNITHYILPSGSSTPAGITVGTDQAIWFTEHTAHQIGRITMAGEITEYPTPTAASGPVGITLGPDGALWFTERSANQIGRITTDGEITEYPVPTPDSFLLRITAASDDALWFTEFRGNKIGRITTDGEITEYELPPGAGPVGITAGTDTPIWFTEFSANKIACITTEGEVTEYEIPTPNSEPFSITIAADNAIWFTGNVSGKIGRLQVQVAQTPFSPEKFEFPLSMTYRPEWYVQEDFSDVVTLRMRQEPTVDLEFLRLEYATIADSEAPYSSIPFPDNFVNWIQSHGMFQVDETRSVIIGGFQGTEIDVTATSACGNRTAFIWFSTTGWVCGEGEFLRFIYLNDVYGEPILIMITGGILSGEDLDAGLGAAQVILDSVQFSQ